MAITVTVNVIVTEALVLRPILRPRAHHRVNPYPGARRQNETDHDKTSPSIAAVSAPSVACSMLAVQQQKKALSPIRRGVRGMTRLPHDEARSVDRPGFLATDIRRSEGVCSRSDL